MCFPLLTVSGSVMPLSFLSFDNEFVCEDKVLETDLFTCCIGSSPVRGFGFSGVGVPEMNSVTVCDEKVKRYFKEKKLYISGGVLLV